MNTDVLTAALTRRSFLATTSLSALATMGLLTACGSNASTGNEASPGPAGAEVTGKLRLLFNGDASEQKRYQEIFAEFKKLHPAVEMEALPDPAASWDAFFSKVQVLIAGGQKFDLIFCASEIQRTFVSKGILQPMDAWFDRDSAEVAKLTADVHPNLLKYTNELSANDGHRYYLPYVFNTACIWYRKSMFAAAGIDEPTPDWTWDQFHAAAQALTKPGKVYGFNAAPEYFWGILPWLYTNEADVLNADWTKATIAEPAAVASVEFAQRFVSEGISPTPGGAFDQLVAVTKGQLAMFCAGWWPIPAMRDAGIVDDLAVVPFPQQARLGSPVGIGSLGVVKQSENKEAAWAFMKFLLSDQVQDFIGRTTFGGGPPARRGFATGAAFMKNSPSGADEFYKALDYSTPLPAPEAANLIQQSVQDSYKQVLAGVGQPKPTLDELAAKIQGYL
jgi:multiple sugar transport system substrate-binding protein